MLSCLFELQTGKGYLGLHVLPSLQQSGPERLYLRPLPPNRQTRNRKPKKSHRGGPIVSLRFPPKLNGGQRSGRCFDVQTIAIAAICFPFCSGSQDGGPRASNGGRFISIFCCRLPIERRERSGRCGTTADAARRLPPQVGAPSVRLSRPSPSAALESCPQLGSAGRIHC